jgi:hypothetical protein
MRILEEGEWLRGVIGWHWIALGYFSYLAALASLSPRFQRARSPALAAAVLAWLSFAAASVWRSPGTPFALVWEVTLPALVLIAGYRLSGRFFISPNECLERRLRLIDDRILAGALAWFRQAPLPIIACFELSYLLVYAAVPAGAATLALAGHGADIGRFWTVVLLAEFSCYGMLPWIQTRPPRALEAGATARPTLFRRLNRGVMDRASIQVNTVPSGHAAGALATALAVGSSEPAAGAVFLVFAASIVAATVLGRYHYLVDSVLGVFVAIAAWLLVRPWPA